jgi:hypothetical protein
MISMRAPLPKGQVRRAGRGRRAGLRKRPGLVPAARLAEPGDGSEGDGAADQCRYRTQRVGSIGMFRAFIRLAMGPRV